jgi:hypothetical protein
LNQALQLADAGLLHRVVGSKLAERFERATDFCASHNSSSSFELRKNLVGVSHPVGILDQLGRSVINSGADADEADSQPGSRRFDFVACQQELRMAHLSPIYQS